MTRFDLKRSYENVNKCFKEFDEILSHKNELQCKLNFQKRLELLKIRIIVKVIWPKSIERFL